MPSIIVFSGQGSQFVGMGKKLLHIGKVKRMFEIANEVFKFDLLSLCLNGPKHDLDRTDKTQAAVFVTSMAAVEFLKETQAKSVQDCYATAGFSIGEYASLVLAGSLSFEDALRVIKVRANGMQEASERVPSGLMSAFLGKQSELNLAMMAARKWCHEKLKMNEPIVCEIANHLFSGCKVVGGNTEALDFIELNYKEFKLNRVKRLPVSGAFHTKLMKSAEDQLANELKNVSLKRPLIDFYSNYEGAKLTNPNKIRTCLIRQIASPVKWEQILNQMYYDENLPLDNEDNAANLLGEERSASSSNSLHTAGSSLSEKKLKKLQTQNRIYPEIYECGPAAQTGPILRAINRKAYQFYKHIEV